MNWNGSVSSVGVAQPCALVTGSTKGIGKAIAFALLGQGYFVLMNFVFDEVVAQATADEFHQAGFHDFLILPGDLSSQETVDEFIEKVRGVTSQLSCLVCNVGVTDRTPFASVEYTRFLQVMETNLLLPFYLVQQLADSMVFGGNILFMGSSLGTYPHATSLAYGVSKAGLEALARNLVKEFASQKVRVNIVAPGFVDTQWQKEKPPEIRARIEGKIALERFSQPEEIAQMCLAIIENGYINGTCVAVDGGYSFR